MNSVVHFEVPFEDQKRMINFYEKSFGWQMMALGDEMGNYVLATTIETDEKGPKKPGGINGGFAPKTENGPGRYPSLVIAVDDINEAMKKVTENGGKVLAEPVEIAGIGRYVSFMDTEGNFLSLLQPLPRG